MFVHSCKLSMPVSPSSAKDHTLSDAHTRVRKPRVASSPHSKRKEETREVWNHVWNRAATCKRHLNVQTCSVSQALSEVTKALQAHLSKPRLRPYNNVASNRQSSWSLVRLRSRLHNDSIVTAAQAHYQAPFRWFTTPRRISQRCRTLGQGSDEGHTETLSASADWRSGPVMPCRRRCAFNHLSQWVSPPGIIASMITCMERMHPCLQGPPWAFTGSRRHAVWPPPHLPTGLSTIFLDLQLCP
jgi:hypothetical protein